MVDLERYRHFKSESRLRLAARYLYRWLFPFWGRPRRSADSLVDNSLQLRDMED
jgi:hypothetical protein